MAKPKKKPYNPAEVEDKIYKLWMKSGYFNPDKLKKTGAKKPFVILLPPPNVTGSLHMGHALNATGSDILIRWQRMKGSLTAWLPGIDHAGIATQRVVEKKLRKKGINKLELGREKFLKEVWSWKEEHGDIISGQLKKLGASCDWSRNRFTMDPQYSKDVLETFVHYHKKGLIYRGLRTINWCVRCHTSLSDLEVEYREEGSSLYHIKYGPFVVATTRPETKFGDTALAVSPKDKRYKKYIGKEIEIETLATDGDLAKPRKIKMKLKVVGDTAVDPEFGTGVLKVTPAHDILDFEISQRHDLPIVQVIDRRGKMSEGAGKYEGMKVDEARKKVVEDLKAIDLLIKEEPYHHRTAVCYRCNSTIEPLPSKQWFMKMDKLAKVAAEIVKKKKTVIIPKNFEKGYFSWLNNIRDWCISRQLWWGHQLPVWFCKNNEDEFIVSVKQPAKCSVCKKCKPQQSEDVLDTWFSSALWPFAGLNKKDQKTFYPSSVLTTARDIINLWVGRMIFSGIEFKKKTPFSTVLIHGTILAKNGQRMSKSLGTGIDPLDLINQYGADATRFGIIWQSMGTQDIRWDESAVVAGKKFTNKIWNATRFVMGQIDKKETFNANLKKPRATKPFNKKILAQLEKTKKGVEKNISNYQFGQALHKFYEFFWHNYCDVCLEKAKNNPSKETSNVLFYVLVESLKLAHPFMPFVTEEIYQSLPLKDKKLLMIKKW
jgi:valyl-tRNA synthetase